MTTIDSLSHDGRGVAHVDGKATFILGALPGEEVSFKYSLRRRNLDEGVVDEVLRPSPERVTPRCDRFGVCGGCTLQHLDPKAQVRAKQQTLLDSLTRIGGVEPDRVLEPLTADNPWGYRRKARLGAKLVHKKGRVLVGFRERGAAFITDLERCEILYPPVGERLADLGELISRLSIRDQIPQIELAAAEDACVLVFRILQPLTSEDRRILNAFGRDNCLYIYTQEGGPKTIKALNEAPQELAYDLPEYGVKIRFLPTDFTQVNFELNRLMVQRAMELLDPQPEERVLDLFCGLGNFTLPISTLAAEVVGVEGDAGLVRRARENATLNDRDNARFFTADLFGDLSKEPWLRDRYQKALLDPPRSGAAEVLEHLPRCGVERILYVSCYPATLARDAGELVKRRGYRLSAAGVMDMFPHTAHLESIAVFDRE